MNCSKCGSPKELRSGRWYCLKCASRAGKIGGEMSARSKRSRLKSDAQGFPQAEEKVSTGYVVIVKELPGRDRGTIVRAIWDAGPRTGDLLPLMNSLKELPTEVLSTTDKTLAAQLRDALLALGCKVGVSIRKLGIPTFPIDHLREDPANPRLASYAEADAQLTGDIANQFPDPIPCPGHEVRAEISDEQFRAHISRLVDLYLESYRDDEGVADEEPLRGTVEEVAKDFGIFIDSLDGIAEEPQTCFHGTPMSQRCEECVAEGKYTHDEPRTQNNS